MLTYDQINVTVRVDNIVSLVFRMNEGYDGFSFYADVPSMCAFLRCDKGSPDVMRDVFRVAIRFMERITFCDLSRAMEKGDARPKLELECYNMHLPFRVGEILAKRIEEAWETLTGAARLLGAERMMAAHRLETCSPDDEERRATLAAELKRLDSEIEIAKRAQAYEERFEISHSERAHWAGMYGIGKGSVKVEFTNDDVKNKFEAKLAAYAGLGSSEKTADESPVQKEARTFEHSLSSLKAIAKNTTTCATDVGVLRIGPDWAGFTFSAGGLFGGLIFHEASGEWSVHT
jgi:hypothetical protein